jgi:hypothetical protein
MRWIISVDLMILVVAAGATAGFSLQASLLHFVGFPQQRVEEAEENNKAWCQPVSARR